MVSPGSRTLGKITNRSDTPIPSILDDLAILNATVRGAYVAGAPPMSLYGLYSYLVGS